MNKRITFWTTAFLLVGALSANAADIPTTAGNYHYLTTQLGEKTYYLSLDGTRADSVIVKTLDEKSASKAACDSALWEITSVGNETAGAVYQFKNKKTNAVLSFPASQGATSVLGEGVSKWVISSNDQGIISSTLADGKVMTLSVKSESDKNTIVFTGSTNNKFSIKEPGTLIMKAADLGAGFATFQLAFDAKYEGDLFSGKDLIATPVEGETEYLNLQVKGDESYPDGIKKYLAVGKEKIDISGAEGAYGSKFIQDSIHTHGDQFDAFYKQFNFKVNLKDESLSMFVRLAPGSDDRSVQVVYATLDKKKVLTVADLAKSGETVPKQGDIPSIRVSRGTPASISTGSGVYFLKSASKMDTGGKYIVDFRNNQIEVMEGTPSVHQLKGQWYIKEENNKYSIVSREKNAEFAMEKEIFAVPNMPNTYTFGEKTDSVTVEFQQVNLADQYLGSLYFTPGELSDNGYVLNLIPGTAGVDKLYAYTSGTILQMKNGDGTDALVFRLIPGDKKEIGGAKRLGDIVYQIPYKLQNLSDDRNVAEGKENNLEFSANSSLSFVFLSDPTGQKYTMRSENQKNVSLDVKTSNLILSDRDAYFTLEEVAAPQYASFENNHKEISFDGRSLTMNPVNYFAELKENPMMKAEMVYEYNFSLWVEKAAASVPGKSLYFISTDVPHATAINTDSPERYYMVPARDASLKDPSGNIRVHFIQNADIKTMENSPALFAFKTTDEGGYYLENQKELSLPVDQQAPYVGYINGYLVMQKEKGAIFEVKNAPIPTATEQVKTHEIKIYGDAGRLIITNANGKKISVSNILGQRLDTRLADSDFYTIPISRGLVIVTVEGELTEKAIVR